MSQSSTSSRKSSELRIRKSSSNESSSQSWAKSRRSKLSLKKNALHRMGQIPMQKSSQSSTESSITKDNEEDTQSSKSVSTFTMPSQSTASTLNQDYALLSSQFSINLMTVLKHYAILTNKPHVPIVKIKTEAVSPKGSVCKSPILGAQKKIRKLKLRSIPTSDSLSIHQNLNNMVSQNINDYFQSLTEVNIKQEVVSPVKLSEDNECEISEEKLIKPLILNRKVEKQWVVVSSHSEEEFELSQKPKEHKKSETKIKDELMSTPPNKEKSSNSKKNQRKSSFWLNNFKNDKPVNKKKFIETFEKKNTEPEIKTESSDDELFSIMPIKRVVVEKDEDTKVNKRLKLKSKRTSKCSSNDNKIEDQSFNSLAVNCQAVYNRIKIENSPSKVMNESENNIPLSFGSDLSNSKQEIECKNNNSNSKASKQLFTKKQRKKVNTVKNDINLEKANTVNSIFSLSDSTDTPTILSTNQKIEPVKASTPNEESKNPEETSKRKGKPIIISDNKLPNNTIFVPNLKKVHSNKSEPKNQVMLEKNGESQILSNSLKSNIKKNDISNAFENITNLNCTTAKSRIVKTSLVEPKLNLKTTDDISLMDESFDNICKDLDNIIYGDITLYKGTEKTPAETLPKKVIATSTLKKIPVKKNTNSRGLHSNNHKEIIQIPKSKRSPIIFNRSPELTLPVNKDSMATPRINNTQNERNKFIVTKASIIQNPTSALNKSIGSATNLLLSTPNSSVTLSNSSSRDPRLNRSFSPKSSDVLTDPRLKSRNLQAQLNSSEATVPISEKPNDSSVTEIVDPRLRKRKERELQEIAAKDTNEVAINEVKQEVSTPSIHSETSNFTPSKKRRLSVFHRLGMKTPDIKTEDPEPNEIFNIVKPNRCASFRRFDDGSDDELSLHPRETFSSDEDMDTNTSPRHRKFTSERARAIEENRNQSIKNRIGWNNLGQTAKPPSLLTVPVPTKLMLNRNVKNVRQPVQAPTTPVPLLPTTNIVPNPLNKTTSAISLSSYSTNDTVFNENFFKMNAAQMLEDVDNLRNQDSEELYVSFDDKGQTTSTKFDSISILDKPSEPVQIGLSDPSRTSFFKNYCYRILRRGMCLQEKTCNFSHQTSCLYKFIKQKRPEFLNPILDFAVQNNFEHFLRTTWKSILPILQHNSFSIFEKYYKASIRHEGLVLDLLDFCLSNKVHTVESFIKRISSIIEKDDQDTVRIICQAIKGKLTDGFCWEAIKDLCQKAIPPNDMIELTLLQCLKRKKHDTHIAEVYDLVKNKIGTFERNKISKSLLTQFYNLVQSRDMMAKTDTINTVPLVTRNTLPLTASNINSLQRDSVVRKKSTDSIKSQDSDKKGKIQSLSTIMMKKNINQTSPNNDTSIVQQPNDSPLEETIAIPTKGESTDFEEYNLVSIDADEPKSAFRDRFWKLYVAVNAVNQGLNHIDYEYVWKILDEFSKEEIGDEVLKRAYYHILCNNVKNCERHLTEIIKQAVRSSFSKSRKSTDLLFEVGVYALIDLADNELWVLALQLLNSIKILEPDEPRTIFVLISAEIYLANNDPLEALYLLQRTKLIRTNRDEWLAKDSTKEAEEHRNKLIYILLQALTMKEPDKAVYLFKTLMVDQYIAYYPVDLPQYLDKLVLRLLMQNKEKLVIDICRLVMDKDLTFRKETYQELLCHLLPIDEILTNQILDYAIHLGYYNDIQIRHGFTTLIIDINYREEEVFLMLKKLMHKLVLNIGPAVQHLKINQLKVIIIFEDIPNERRLYVNEIATIQKDKYKGIKNLVNFLLSSRFTPPIRLSRGKPNKYCKIMSRTLVDYLKHWN